MGYKSYKEFNYKGVSYREVDLDQNFYRGNPEKYATRTTNGHDFETTFIAAMRVGFEANDKHAITQVSGTVWDVEQGTDAVIDAKMRIDPTLNFANKSFMPFYMDTGIKATHNQTFKIGLRHGNTHDGYSEFDQTVVVIGLDMLPMEYTRYERTIKWSVVNNAEKLNDIARKCWRDYSTVTPEKREKLKKMPLQPNPKYREPRDIGSKYKHYNALQRSLAEQGDEKETPDKTPVPEPV